MAFILLGIIFLGAVLGTVIEIGINDRREKILNTAIDKALYVDFLKVNDFQDSDEVREKYKILIYGEWIIEDQLWSSKFSFRNFFLLKMTLAKKTTTLIERELK